MKSSGAEGPYAEQLQVAIQAAREAESIILGYFSSAFDVSTKSDDSPVTEADISAEKTIRRVLTESYPDYGFYGEETGTDNLQAEYLWLVDPIDGTKSFVRHSPFFSTQIALMHKGEIVVGVSNAPAYGEMAHACKHGGAILNDKPLQVSAVESLSQAFLSTGNLKSLTADSARWAGLGVLMSQVARIRGYGDFCHYHQLAGGQADIIVESDVNILDIAALSLIVTEAGGRFTDLEGQAVDLETTSVLATANRQLSAAVSAVLQSVAS